MDRNGLPLLILACREPGDWANFKHALGLGINLSANPVVNCNQGSEGFLSPPFTAIGPKMAQANL